MKDELFRMERLPVLQNRTFATRQEAINSPTGDVVLVQDSCTGLVYNSAFDSSRIVYGEHYQNEQACSVAFRRHLDDVLAIIARHAGSDDTMLEIGCGKGFFLERLLQHGFDVTGIDPAYEGKNPRVVRAHFGKELGLAGDFIVLRHVLEHIPDPVSFLASIAAANGDRGTVYIEVPCFDWICDHRAWFDIFYEHVNYFRLSDFQRMFGQVHEAGRVFGGQYIYVVADLSTLRRPAAAAHDSIVVPDFLQNLSEHLQRARMTRRHPVVWGAASKGVIFALYMQRAGLEPTLVIDINPAKHNRYLPVTGLQVLSPDSARAVLTEGDDIFVMNSNYLEEIVAQSGNRYSYIAVDK